MSEGLKGSLLSCAQSGGMSEVGLRELRNMRMAG